MQSLHDSEQTPILLTQDESATSLNLMEVTGALTLSGVDPAEFQHQITIQRLEN